MPPDGHFSRHACQKSYDLYLTEVRSLLNSTIKCCKLLIFFLFSLSCTSEVSFFHFSETFFICKYYASPRTIGMVYITLKWTANEPSEQWIVNSEQWTMNNDSGWKCVQMYEMLCLHNWYCSIRNFLHRNKYWQQIGQWIYNFEMFDINTRFVKCNGADFMCFRPQYTLVQFFLSLAFWFDFKSRWKTREGHPGMRDWGIQGKVAVV